MGASALAGGCDVRIHWSQNLHADVLKSACNSQSG